MNKNLFKMKSKLSSKDTKKTLKNTLYKNQNNGIYSSNNLKPLKINNGIIIKNICQKILNEEKLTSNRKKNFKRKFNNLIANVSSAIFILSLKLIIWLMLLGTTGVNLFFIHS